MPATIILRLGRRYIARRFFQSVLFVLGVALGVGVVIAIDLANNSASRAFDLSTESISGKTTHQIIGGPAGLPTTLYATLRIDLGLRDSAPVIEEAVRSEELGDRPLRLLGIDPFAEPPFRDYLNTIDLAGEDDSDPNATFAALNDFIAEPGAILISATLAERFGVTPGDPLTLRVGGKQTLLTVVGVLRGEDRVSEQALADLVLTDIATAQEIAGLPGAIHRIDLILPADYDTASLEALLPAGAALVDINQANGTLQQLTAAFELNLQALSLLALVVGVFLIYNTVTFSVIQRRPVIGILRALGATREQIFALILGEAFLLGVIGTVLGLAVGVIFGRGAVALVSRTVSDIYFTVNVQGVAVDPATLLKGGLIGLFASVIAAVIPSFEATRTPPAGTLRRSDVELRSRRNVPLITLIAVVLLIAGFLLLQLPTRDLVISFVALFCFVLGGAFLTPLVLTVTMRFATPLTGRVFGVLGRMAPRAVVRSLSRTSVAVAALTVAVSVIVGVSVMIGSFRNTVSDWLETTLGADIYISPPTEAASRTYAGFDPALVEVVGGIEGIEQVVTVRAITVSAPDYPDLPPVHLAAASDDIASRQRRFAWIDLTDETAYWSALQSGQILVSESFAFRRGISSDDNTLTLTTDRGPETFEVVGVYYDYSTDQGVVLMADEVYREYYDDPFISSIAAYVAPDADLDALVGRLQDETLAGTDLQAQDYRGLRAGVFEVFDRAFAITVALRLLATVVAFIGILSALLSLQLEHTREYGVMRAVGLTPRQLWRFTLIQTGLMGTVAGALALPIGLVLALVLIFVINVRSFGWTMQLFLLPEHFIQAFAVAVVAALAAGVYPAWRLSRLVTAQALRRE